MEASECLFKCSAPIGGDATAARPMRLVTAWDWKKLLQGKTDKEGIKGINKYKQGDGSDDVIV